MKNLLIAQKQFSLFLKQLSAQYFIGIFLVDQLLLLLSILSILSFLVFDRFEIRHKEPHDEGSSIEVIEAAHKVHEGAGPAPLG